MKMHPHLRGVLHKVDRFRCDQEVIDELDLKVRHNQNRPHHFPWLMERSSCLAGSLVIRKSRVSVQCVYFATFCALFAHIFEMSHSDIP